MHGRASQPSKRAGSSRARDPRRRRLAPRPRAALAALGWPSAPACGCSLAAALVSTRPTAGHAVAPLNETLSNWCGPSARGSRTSSCCWAGARGRCSRRSASNSGCSPPASGGQLAVRWRRRAHDRAGRQRVPRLLFPAFSSAPEGARGVLADRQRRRNSRRDSAAWARLWIALLGVIGLVVAFDHLVLVGPAAARMGDAASPAPSRRSTSASPSTSTTGETSPTSGARARPGRSRPRPARERPRRRRDHPAAQARGGRTRPALEEAPPRRRRGGARRGRRRRRRGEAREEESRSSADRRRRGARDRRRDRRGRRRRHPRRPAGLHPRGTAREDRETPRGCRRRRRSATEDDLADLQAEGERRGYQFPPLDLLETPTRTIPRRWSRSARQAGT